MKNHLLKVLLVFGLGGVVGALGANIVLKKKYEQIVEEEITSIREVAATRQSSRPAWQTRNTSSDCDVNSAYSDDVAPDTDEAAEMYEYENISRENNYSGYASIPYLISIEEFSEEMPHFDKLTIHYYAYDNTLVDENEEIIPDIAVIVGDCIPVAFGDQGVVYVRNECISVDYEVILISKSYAETVM